MQDSLTAFYTGAYCRGPWIVFGAGNGGIGRSEGERYCQPDGLFLDFRHGLCVIAEIKIRHTERAWWQLRQLYEPVMRSLLQDAPWDFACLEVCRAYDPAVEFPERHDFVDNPLTMRAGQFGVMLHRV